MAQVPLDILNQLRSHGQEHVLTGWETLAPPDRTSLLDQLARLDLAELTRLYKRLNEPIESLPPPEALAPIPVEPPVVPPEIRALGQIALARGEVAALMVAGGQGSRLGSDKPKGLFPVGPVSGAPLYQIHAEKVLALSRRTGHPIPLLVMTSPATHSDTVSFFHENRYFGLPMDQIAFFQQGTMPAMDLATGRLLLESPGKIFVGPNGHGGTLTALAESGLLAEMKQRGVRHIFYFQVDNPLVNICDPGFVGLHIARNSEASSKVVFKEHPAEKVGILSLVHGRCGIVEYSDLPADLAAQREHDGSLRYRAGNPAIHLFTVPFLERVTAHDTGLAYHLARKKVPHFDPITGRMVEPERENALKFELFIFDALPLADRWLAMETLRTEEFAPLKNGSGPDSPDTVRQAITRLHGSWLERAGLMVPRNPEGEPLHPLEVSPLFALDADELAAKIPPGRIINAPHHFGASSSSTTVGERN